MRKGKPYIILAAVLALASPSFGSAVDELMREAGKLKPQGKVRYETQMMDELVISPQNASTRYEGQLTGLMILAMNPYLEPGMTKKAIEYGYDVNAEADNGMTALMYAAMVANNDVARLLIDSGADVNAKDKMAGLNALMYSVSANNLECIRILLEAGADVNAKNVNGTNALELAEGLSASDEVKKVLLEAMK